MSDPSTPNLLDTADTYGTARDVFVANDKVYVAARGMRVYEVSGARETPVPTTSTPVPGAPTTVAPGRQTPPPAKEFIPSWVWVVVGLGAVGVLGFMGVACFALGKKNSYEYEEAHTVNDNVELSSPMC